MLRDEVLRMYQAFWPEDGGWVEAEDIAGFAVYLDWVRSL